MKESDVTIDDVSGYLFGTLKNKMRDFASKPRSYSSQDIVIFYFLKSIIEFVFYVYANVITATRGYVVAQIVLAISRMLLSAKMKNFLYKKEIAIDILRELHFIIASQNLDSKSKGDLLNILIVSRHLLNAFKRSLGISDEYEYSQKTLLGFFDLHDKEVRLNYFQIVTLLYYIENKTMYSDIHNRVCDQIKERFKRKECAANFLDTEHILLFFDILACPYIPDDVKSIVMKSAPNYPANNIPQNKVLTDAKTISSMIHFMEWKLEIDLEYYLWKKEKKTTLTYDL